MRVVGGRLRGRALAGPVDDAIRPTSDRLRGAIFNILAHAYGDPVAGARVLDLFAGTGAMGIEALSRGAAFAVFVDEDAGAGGLIRRNLDAFGLGGAARLVRRDARRLGPAAANGAFELVFCDPPYGRALAWPALKAARDGGWLAAGALVVMEERSREAHPPEDGFALREHRAYGGTGISILRVESEPVTVR